MKITKLKIPDVRVIEPETLGDKRGWFFESYNKRDLKEAGIDIIFTQDNHSFSAQKGTLRGMHIQKSPHTQSKLIRCTRGKILDVVVDLRQNSPTYLKWVSSELSAKNKKQLFAPQGFAHGFLTLEPNTEVQYKVDKYYSKTCDLSIRFDDPQINITWPIENPVLSNKDKSAPYLKDLNLNFK